MVPEGATTMHATAELLSREAFADRLGLTHDTLSRLACSKVADAITVFYDVNGEALAEHSVQMHPFMDEDEEAFLIYGEVLTEPVQSERLIA
jgi:hypothetical protein